MKSPISKYIKNGRINIPNSVWCFLKEVYSQDELIDWISTHVIEGDIVLPLLDLTEEDARKDFEDLCKYNPQDMISGVNAFSRFAYTRPMSGRVISDGSIGHNASNFFQQFNRYCTGHCSGKPSPVELWKDKKQVSQLLKAIWTLKDDAVNTSTLQASIRMRAYVASQFRPAVAKAIYTHYNATEVLDTSMGWGDRLVAAAATSSVKKYIGTDPNPNTFPIYKEQVDFYKNLSNTTGDFELYNLPAEELDLPEGCVDLTFTSPPYFSCEKYCDDDKQSFKRYTTVDQWFNGFLKPTIDLCYKALRSGGYMIWNISDIFIDTTPYRYCDRMCDYIETLPGMHFEEIVGMRMSKRPNCSTKDMQGTFCEPIFVFKKD